MIFNQNQINFLLKTLDTQIVFFIAKHIGIDSLTEEDLNLLKHRGIDINKLKLESSSNTLSQAYKFGILAKSLGDSRTKDMKYPEFLNFIKSGKFVPLNEREENTLNYLKHQTYHDIKGLGNKISKDLTTVHIEASQQQREKYEKLISEEAQKTVLNRESVKSMVSRLGELTQDWNRDFGRIAETVLHTAYEEGRAAALERTRGKEVLVYKDVFPGACRFCIQHYLTDGIGSKPRIFKLSELRANGTNIGKKQAEWKAVLGAMHPFCRCTLYELPDGYAWDEEKKNFIPHPELYKRKVARKSKIKVTIGDKESEI